MLSVKIFVGGKNNVHNQVVLDPKHMVVIVVIVDVTFFFSFLLVVVLLNMLHLKHVDLTHISRRSRTGFSLNKCYVFVVVFKKCY